MKKINVTNTAIVGASALAVWTTAKAMGMDYPSTMVAIGFTSVALSNAGVNMVEQPADDDTSATPSGKLTVKK